MNKKTISIFWAVVSLVLTTTVHAGMRVIHLHGDHLGSPSVATDQAGDVVLREQYRPYGERIYYSDNSDTIVGFTGHAEDADTGLVYMQARYYSPLLGRFLAVDPVAAKAGDVHNFNRYVYGNNHPFLFVDPNGRDAIITMKKNGSIDIAIPIKFHGSGATTANTEKMRKDISNSWSGKYSINGVQTPVNVTVTNPGKIGMSNNIWLTNGPTKAQNCGGCSYVSGGNSGEWDVNSSGMLDHEAAHEAGHLMGAEDQYIETRDSAGIRISTTPKAGYQGNLMAESSGRPDDRNISEILKSKNNLIMKE